MAIQQALLKIGILLISFGVGLSFFYVTSTFATKDRKYFLDQVISQLINFIIFIWIGKIIYHFDIFIEDPLAVLAYPSDVNAFYIASLLLIILISYQVMKGKIHLPYFIQTFFPVFLSASFVYEFIQLMFYEAQNIYTLTLLMVLLLGYLFGWKQWQQQLYLIVLWASGQVVISFFVPFITIFDYIISRLFFIGIILLAIILYSYHMKRRVA